MRKRTKIRLPRRVVAGHSQWATRSTVITLIAIALAGCAQRTDPAPVDSVYNGRTIYDYTRGSLSAPIYEVQRGDTLYSIAFRAEMDLRDIARLNNLSEPYQIFPGQELRLAPESSGVRVASVKEVPDRTNNNRNTVKERKDTSQTDLTPPVASKNEQEYGGDRTAQKTSSNSSSVVQAQQPTASAAARSPTATSPAQRPQPQRAASASTTSSASGNIEWHWPSQGRIVQRFRSDRPGASGIIFSGVKGDPVTAAAAGRVVYVGSALRGFGRLIIVKHNDDFITAYAHNDQLLVREQETVAAGQKIATMGDSDADDIRLRFELRYQGSSVNPEQYLPRSR